MLNEIVKHIKTFIAQQTALFDISSIDKVAVTQANIITITGLDGEYTISGGVDGIASAGCMNDTHTFNAGSVEKDNCFFGDDPVNHDVKVRTLNVGHAYRREVAREMIINPESGNSIVVYDGDARNISSDDKYSDSEDKTLEVAYTVGVMFKVNLQQAKSLGCIAFDKLFINSVIGAKKELTSQVKFNSIIERFFASESYIVDIEFSYIDSIFMDDEFLAGLKHFEATFGELIINN